VVRRRTLHDNQHAIGVWRSDGCPAGAAGGRDEASRIYDRCRLALADELAEHPRIGSSGRRHDGVCP
jgi:hypothetical protein